MSLLDDAFERISGEWKRILRASIEHARIQGMNEAVSIVHRQMIHHMEGNRNAEAETLRLIGEDIREAMQKHSTGGGDEAQEKVQTVPEA